MRTPLDVVVPAHEEQALLPRCLRALLWDARDVELRIVVVANGCTDATPAAARRFVPAARELGHELVVLELPVAGKAAALNAASPCLRGCPVVFPTPTLSSRPARCRRSPRRSAGGHPRCWRRRGRCSCGRGHPRPAATPRCGARCRRSRATSSARAATRSARPAAGAGRSSPRWWPTTPTSVRASPATIGWWPAARSCSSCPSAASSSGFSRAGDAATRSCASCSAPRRTRPAAPGAMPPTSSPHRRSGAMFRASPR